VARRAITAAPRWLSTDLRGRQPGADRPDEPVPQAHMFELLVRMGYKEIEVGFPSASQADFDFVRSLIERRPFPATSRSRCSPRRATS
jgi:2-isopropylmalate synthase